MPKPLRAIRLRLHVPASPWAMPLVSTPRSLREKEAPKHTLPVPFPDADALYLREARSYSTAARKHPGVQVFRHFTAFSGATCERTTALPNQTGLGRSNELAVNRLGALLEATP